MAEQKEDQVASLQRGVEDVHQELTTLQASLHTGGEP
jgi:hypothetical protein